MQVEINYARQLSLTETGLFPDLPRNAYLSRLDYFTSDLLNESP